MSLRHSPQVITTKPKRGARRVHRKSRESDDDNGWTHAHAPLPDPRTPTAQPQDAQIRAAYGNFLRGMRRDIVRPFLMGAAAAFGMSLGAPCLNRSNQPTARSHASATRTGYALWDMCGRTLVLLSRAAGPRLRGSVKA